MAATALRLLPTGRVGFLGLPRFQQHLMLEHLSRGLGRKASPVWVLSIPPLAELEGGGAQLDLKGLDLEIDKIIRYTH